MLIHGRLVTPDGVLEHGRVTVDGDTITAVEPVPDADAAAATGWIVPGFVDIHHHGGGGHTVTTGDADATRRAAAFHLAHGTTTLLASLVSSPVELMRHAVTAYAPLVGDDTLAGLHFEGPYLSTVRCGAQNPAYLRDPDPAELAALLDLGAGSIRMVTLAPERPGALAAIARLVDAGVVAAIGHTDASYDQTRAAIDAGASVGTHVFNGMRPPHHREPGPVFALLGDARVICELVADGVHLHDGTLAFAASVTGPRRAALITDAMAAAGMPDGEYELGGQPVVVADSVARLARDSSIAGSTLTMDAALRRAVAAGIDIVDAAAMAATTPAAAIGLAGQVGALVPGLRADLVELDDALRVRRVLRAGNWV
ncbi:N-acetylglucosamine-6-phosphate deacetylase [Micromonospora sp. NBC_01813]|uniref:N-acetylglucosamine-6-phosphate deacetylase n=1 Tax=Micromonospora sp. NBC_01813 TaxID=2975988 RepID=UPI002DD94871|nr:N-acetylglucosamine-6-phosphate deacetylase [Micromonospora sp. NBC_01813]WSA06587.1 N-acetylglucosamine-6-phosphate deacetylase [Micromonospora sp. NBC_01813]